MKEQFLFLFVLFMASSLIHRRFFGKNRELAALNGLIDVSVLAVMLFSINFSSPWIIRQSVGSNGMIILIIGFFVWGTFPIAAMWIKAKALNLVALDEIGVWYMSICYSSIVAIV